MSGLRRADRVVLATLVPFWALCVLLHVDRQISGPPLAWFPLYLEAAPSADSHPRVLHPWPDAELTPESVRAGDELLAAGERDLRGAGRVFTIGHAYAAAREGRVPFRVLRDGVEQDASLLLNPVPAPWTHLWISISLGLLAVLVLLRGRGARAPRAFALAALAFSLHFCSLQGGSPGRTAFAFGLIIASGALYPPLLLRAALLFPPSAAPASERALAWPWLFAVTGPALYVWIFGAPSLGLFGFAYASACFTATIACFLWILARNYRSADTRGRRQMHWGLYGVFLGTAPPLLLSAVAAANPSLRWLYEGSLAFQVLVPVFFAIALVRDNLFDIHRLITTTIACLLVAPVILALGALLAPVATRWLGEQAQLQEATATFALALAAVLGVALPAIRLRPALERRIFREQFRLERALRDLRGAVDGEEGGALVKKVGERLASLDAFETCAVYGRAGDAFVAVSAHGPLVPPAFAADGPLHAVLEQTDGPLLARVWQRLARAGALTPQEGAALESLAAEIVLPLRRDESLEAFVVLGPKRSGDVYTRAEISLLESLGERVGLELSRVERDALLAQQLELHEELARYAPGSVVEELTRGGDTSPGEREVTVLFVDIRGYSSLSRGRSAPEVFEAVNRYTLVVSARIRERGGSVVEFHGDGLMAAFGAPSALDEKERRALEAAVAIVKDVRSGAAGELDGQRIDVGVGIATGAAYVGDIQSIDRKIWGVIGTTTNLAARLEALTRTLDAAIVIDETTHHRAAESAQDFRPRDGVRVKGWDEPLRVWSFGS